MANIFGIDGDSGGGSLDAGDQAILDLLSIDGSAVKIVNLEVDNLDVNTTTEIKHEQLEIADPIILLNDTGTDVVRGISIFNGTTHDNLLKESITDDWVLTAGSTNSGDLTPLADLKVKDIATADHTSVNTSLTDLLGSNLKNNFVAIVAPVFTNDSSEDYAVGSVWVDTVLDKSWVCVDSSVGGAVWKETSVLGEVNTMSSLGGTYSIYASKSGSNLRIKGINGSGTINVSDDGSILTLSANYAEINDSSTASDVLWSAEKIDNSITSLPVGEVNTMSSLGGTYSIFGSKNLSDLRIKGINGSGTINVSDDGSILTLSANYAEINDLSTASDVLWSADKINSSISGISPGEINTASSVGTGTSIIKDKSVSDLRFKSLKATSTKIGLISNTDDVGIDVNVANLVNDAGTTVSDILSASKVIELNNTKLSLPVAGFNATAISDTDITGFKFADASVVRGRYLFVAVKNNTGDVQTLRSYDLVDPTDPVLLDSLAGAIGGQMVVSGTNIFKFSSGLGVSVISTTAPANMVNVFTFQGLETISALAVNGRYVYTSNLANIQTWEFLGDDAKLLDTLPLASVVALVVDGGHLYASSTAGTLVHALSLANGADPTAIGSTINLGINGESMAGQEGNLYITASNKLIKINVKDPTAMSKTEVALAPAGLGWRSSVQGNFIFVLDFSGGFWMYRTSDLTLVQHVVNAFGGDYYTMFAFSHYVGIIEHGNPFVPAGAPTSFPPKAFIYDVNSLQIDFVEFSGVEAGALNVRANLNVGQDVSIGNTLSVGAGLFVQGDSSYAGTISVGDDHKIHGCIQTDCIEGIGGATIIVNDNISMIDTTKSLETFLLNGKLNPATPLDTNKYVNFDGVGAENVLVDDQGNVVASNIITALTHLATPLLKAQATNLTIGAVGDTTTFAGTVAGLTASDVGLGNATNESKATMFTSPTFTGTTNTGDLTITGNLTVVGTNMEISTTSVLIDDPIILIGDDNGTFDTINLGINMQHQTDVGGWLPSWSGLLRYHADKKFYLYNSETTQPTITTNLSLVGRAGLVVSSLDTTILTLNGVDMVPPNWYQLSTVVASTAHVIDGTTPDICILPLLTGDELKRTSNITIVAGTTPFDRLISISKTGTYEIDFSCMVVSDNDAEYCIEIVKNVDDTIGNMVSIHKFCPVKMRDRRDDFGMKKIISATAGDEYTVLLRRVATNMTITTYADIIQIREL